MDETGRMGLGKVNDGRVPVSEPTLFDKIDDAGKADRERVWVEIDVNGFYVERMRDFGGPWLACELMKMLGLPEFFEKTIPSGREEIPWSSMAQILVAARFCDPSSELRIAETWFGRTALDDILGVPVEKVNDDRLYRSLDMLLPHKEAIEKHLKGRFEGLFGIEYDLYLYDVTSTFFEGAADKNPTAKRGYSRDHRTVNKSGFSGMAHDLLYVWFRSTDYRMNKNENWIYSQPLIARIASRFASRLS